MIKCIAVDDEPLALEQLTGYIARVPFLQLIASCQDAFSAMQVLSEEEVDLMFVDIHMPDLNGLDDMCNALLELMKDELDEKREEGIKEGESLGVNRINQLILKLSELNRTDDILKAAADREYQKKLLKEFGL